MAHAPFAAALAAALVSCAAAASAVPDDNPYLPVTGGAFQSALPLDAGRPVEVRPFRLQRHPVTNGEFRAFVASHPRWQRGAVAPVLADAGYLSHWAGPLDPGAGADAQPVTRVSWFAAEAYCAAAAARLPTWHEWEFAAAASVDRADARADPAWRQQVLDWYARPAGGALDAVGRRPANYYGLQDLQGLVWEWVEDFNALLPADADPEQFCGAGSLSVEQKENYPVLMRIALLGSLRAADTGHLVGFRCARDAGGAP